MFDIDNEKEELKLINIEIRNYYDSVDKKFKKHRKNLNIAVKAQFIAFLFVIVLWGIPYLIASYTNFLEGTMKSFESLISYEQTETLPDKHSITIFFMLIIWPLSFIIGVLVSKYFIRKMNTGLNDIKIQFAYIYNTRIKILNYLNNPESENIKRISEYSSFGFLKFNFYDIDLYKEKNSSFIDLKHKLEKHYWLKFSNKSNEFIHTFQDMDNKITSIFENRNKDEINQLKPLFNDLLIYMFIIIAPENFKTGINSVLFNADFYLERVNTKISQLNINVKKIENSLIGQIRFKTSKFINNNKFFKFLIWFIFPLILAYIVLIISANIISFNITANIIVTIITSCLIVSATIVSGIFQNKKN